jgi:hypothetical protein
MVKIPKGKNKQSTRQTPLSGNRVFASPTQPYGFTKSDQPSEIHRRKHNIAKNEKKCLLRTTRATFRKFELGNCQK